jgi:DNA repair exonuclease SbcCD ATPase subunit
MNKQAVDNYRELLQSRLEELTVMNAQQNSELSHIVETLDKIDHNLEKQNNRIRKNENTLTSIKTVGGIVSVVFSGFIGWLWRRI